LADQNFRVKRGLEVGIGATVLSALSSGFVGIGTTNPPDKLTVSGRIQIQQDSGSNNRLVFRGQPGSSYRWNIDNYSSANDFRIFREDDATTANGATLVSISTTGTVTASTFVGALTGTATSIKGGSGGSIPYQSAADTTVFLANGAAGYILQSNGGTNPPTWVPAGSAGAIGGITIRDEGTIIGTAASINTINFVGNIVSAAATAGIATITFLDYVSNAGFATYATNSGIATNLKGGLIGNIPYQSAADTTIFLTNGPSGTILQSNGVGNAPTWVTAAPAGAISGITIRDEGSVVGTANSISQLNFVGSNITATASGGIATITVSDNLVGTGLSITGISTFTNGPLLIGSGTSTGTASQPLQIFGGAYVSGSLGIGTTNPSQKLEVVGGEIKAGRIDTGSEGGQLSFGRATDNLTAWYIDVYGNTSTPILRFVDVSTASVRVAIDSSGNFGIKNATPTSALDVTGDAKISGVITASSFSGNATSATYATNAGIATYATSAGIATYATSAGIATYATSAGIATSAGVATYATSAGIATYATSAGIATYATSAGIATNAGVATYATSAGIATYATSAGIATNAGVATYATSAGIATYASVSGIATYATSAGIATYATSAGIATYATSAGIATYASVAGIATYATNVGVATYATSAGIATYATTSGVSTYANVAGVSTSVIGGIGSITQLSVSGISTLGITSTTNLTAQQLNVSGVGTFQSSNLKIRNPANTFEYSIDGSAIVANRNLTLPLLNTNDTFAFLGLSQTFTAAQTYNSTLTANSILTLTGSGAGTHVFGSSQTSATLTFGGTSGTGLITFGRSTLTQQTDIQAGASGVGTTKTINLGTGGLSGSFTQINIGPGPSAGVGTVVINSGTNLGIGSTTPTVALDVIGGAKFTGVVTASSFSGNVSSATYATSAGIATYATSSGIATYATTAGIATNATYATTAGIATNATYATTAGVSTYSTTAGIATNATYATTAGVSTYSTTAGIATYATSAGIATYATTAGVSTYSTTAGIATYATSAGIATYATSAGVSTSVIGGIASVTQLTVTGVSTLGITSTTNLTTQQLNVSGVSTHTGISTFQSTLFGTQASFTGVVTASSFVGSGANLTSLNATQLTSGTVPAARITASGGDFTVGNNLYVNGNLSVGGTSIILNAAQLQINDRDITLGVTTDALNNDISNDNTANHGGISIASTVGSPIINIPVDAVNTSPSTYKQIMWIKQGHYAGMGTDAWTFNYAVSIGNTSTVQNQSRLTVGAGFTVFDSYLDASSIDIRTRNINISGIGTIATLSGTTATYSTGNFTTGNIVTGVVTTLTSTNATLTNINSSGISTLGVTSTTNLTTQQLNVSGVSTHTGISTFQSTLFGTQASFTGVVTATKFSGDGSLLTNLPTFSSQWVTTSVGIHTLSNVGIGTTNPTSRLTVSGNASITGILTADQVYTSNNGNGQNVRIGDDLWIGDVNLSNTTRFSGNQDSTKAFIIFGTSDSVALGRTGSGPLYYGGDFTISGVATANSFRARGGAPGALGVNNNGYGFFSPGDNDSGMYSSADGQIEFYTNSTEAVRIDSNQRVGIGTTNPGAKLDVYGTTDNIVANESGSSTAWRGRILSKNLAADKAIFLGLYGTDASIASHNYALSAWRDLYLNTVGSGGAGNVITGIGGGNIGVGLTTPTSKLHVLGDTLITGVVTAATFSGQVNAGVGTITTLSGTTATYSTGNFTTGNIVTGVVTTLSGTTATYSTGNFTTGNIVTGIVTTLTSTNATLTNINSAGISTLGITSTTNLTAQQLNVSGVSTHTGISTFQSTLFGTQASFTGVVTATTFSGNVSSATYAINAGIATNLKGGVIGNIPYQNAADTTVFLTNGASGTILQSNGVGNAPSWVPAAPAGAITGLTIRDEGTIVGTVNNVSALNFVGSNITATASGVGATITIADNLVGTGLSISGISTLGITSVTNLTAQQLNVSGVSTFQSSNLKVVGASTSFQYSIVGSTITANRNLTLPLLTGNDTIAVLAENQTFTGSINFTNTLQASGGSQIALSGSSSLPHSFGTSQTTATLTFGGTSGTGLITFGQATTSQQTDIQAGASGVGTTKTINFGTGGLSGSFTQINVGPTAGVGTVTINSGTRLGIGTTVPVSALHVIGDIRVSGVVTATDFNSASDAKLKTNIQPIENALDKVVQIQGVSFNWIENNKPSMGVIADDLQKVLPELVSETDPKTVNYNGLIGLLIEVVKEQQSRIQLLENRISKLE
jgi:Chaperone of endosialidase